MLRHDESNSPYLTPHPSSFSLSYSFSSTNPNPRFERRKEEKKCSISARECFQSQMKILENQRVLSLTLSIKSQKKSLWAVIEELATHKKKTLIITITITIIDLLLKVFIKLNLNFRMNECFELPAPWWPHLKRRETKKILTCGTKIPPMTVKNKEKKEKKINKKRKVL